MEGLFVILVCQLIGEIVVRTLDLSMPAPALGIMLLLAYLWFADWRAGSEDSPAHTRISGVADTLLKNLGVLFVPLGVGVMQNYRLIYDYAGTIIVVVVVSTIVTLMVTVGAFLLASRLFGAEGAGNGH
ncbi:CidA/LrgA family protein [Ensifer sp. HO-A22]|uniref:CidA/LrgA family protein n=1 Tax=Ensifer oleiphilus TaxID=2742698 RepID=A0A7Y6UNL1_9HYPH|nr:CidA/LrgA family protein [Ensifer oleiphilus]NVD40380.1 CidA/LrgA family protein [Ensifer oleiphilus]